MTDQRQDFRNMEFWNNVIESYRSELINFTPFSLKDKSFFEVLASGLEHYSSLPSAESASIVLFDNEEGDFVHKLSIPWEMEQEEKHKFEQLRDSELLAESLGSGELIYRYVNVLDRYILLIPLFYYGGVQGLVYISFKDRVPFPQALFNVIKVYTNLYSLVIQSMLDQRSLLNLNENIEQVIALKTLDVTQNTRDVKYLLDSVQTGILIIDKERNVICDANILAAEIIGTTKDRLIGRTSKEFFFKSGKKLQREIITNQEMLLKKSNQQFIPIIRTTAEVKLENGDFYIISFMDITQRKKMELELQQAREELEQRVQERTADLVKVNAELTSEVDRRIKAEEDLLKFYWAVQQNPVMISLTDADGIIEYVNPRFSEVTGYTFAELIGKNIASLQSGTETSDPNGNISLKTNGENIWSGELTNRKKNGELFWVSSLVSPIQNFEGEITHLVVVQEEITLKKEAEKQIIIAKEKAEASDRLKSNIFANMSHELRTPLISILGFSEILQEELTEEMLVNMVRKIHISGNRLLRTLNTMLLMSQIEYNHLEVIYSVLDISEVLHSIMPTFSVIAEKKGLVLEVFGDDTPLPVFATREMVSTAISAIVDNAVKFTKQGSVKILLEKLFNEDGQGIVRMRVTDTGIGISEKSLPFIYDPFRQDSEGFGRNFEGSGLGLTISKKIIAILKGSINVASVVDQGTTFTIELPLYKKN